MRRGHKQADMISNNTQAGALKLGSTGAAPAITDPAFPKLTHSCFMLFTRNCDPSHVAE